MLSFWDVVKKALRYRDARISAILMLVGCILALVLPMIVSNKGVLNFTLLVVCSLTFIMIDRFSAYIKAIRTQDLEEHGQKVYKDQ